MKAKEALGAAKADVVTVKSFSVASGGNTHYAYPLTFAAADTLEGILSGIAKDVKANDSGLANAEADALSAAVTAAGAFATATAADLDAVADAMEALAEKIGSSLVGVNNAYSSRVTAADVADAQAAFSSLISNATKAIRAEANAAEAAKFNIKVSDGEGTWQPPHLGLTP